MKSKNCDVSPRLKQDVATKVEHATRFFDKLTAIEVVFSQEANPRIAESAVVEITARTKGHHIRAEGAAPDHRDAIDGAVNRFERQLARYKSRLVDRTRGRDRSGAAIAADEDRSRTALAAGGDGPDDTGLAQIVRVKRFDLRPMLPEEAALQLELLGHEFFLFTNARSGASSVVYRRRDGQLGLIEGTDGQE